MLVLAPNSSGLQELSFPGTGLSITRGPASSPDFPFFNLVFLNLEVWQHIVQVLVFIDTGCICSIVNIAVYILINIYLHLSIHLVGDLVYVLIGIKTAGYCDFHPSL